MALTKIGLGTTPNDGTGDDLRTGGQLVNDSFDQIDTNVTDIATNISDIATNVAEIANRVFLQSKSFISPSTAPISNFSSTVYVDTDLVVAITPKSSISKLRIEASMTFYHLAYQTGIRIIIQKKVGAGVWTNILFGNNLETSVFRNSNIGTASNYRVDMNPKTQIDSPGITDEIQFKVTFTGFTDTFESIYSDEQTSMITVNEIKE